MSRIKKSKKYLNLRNNFPQKRLRIVSAEKRRLFLSHLILRILHIAQKAVKNTDKSVLGKDRKTAEKGRCDKHFHAGEKRRIFCQ